MKIPVDVSSDPSSGGNKWRHGRALKGEVFVFSLIEEMVWKY